MKLYLVRHGEAASDPQRSLSPEGIRQAEKTAEWAAGKNLEIIQIRHSGKRRAEQTAEIIGRRIVSKQGVVGVSGLKPDDDVQSAISEWEAEGLPSVMWVGHNPFLGILVHLLLSKSPGSRSLTFHTGTMACLVKDSSGWILQDTFTP